MDVEDGFALKRRSHTRRRKKPSGTDSEHTIPPPPAMHILSSYTLANPTSKRAVTDYVQTQARDEKVLHAETKVSRTHLQSRPGESSNYGPQGISVRLGRILL